MKGAGKCGYLPMVCYWWMRVKRNGVGLGTEAREGKGVLNYEGFHMPEEFLTLFRGDQILFERY